MKKNTKIVLLLLVTLFILIGTFVPYTSTQHMGQSQVVDTGKDLYYIIPHSDLGATQMVPYELVDYTPTEEKVSTWLWDIQTTKTLFGRKLDETHTLTELISAQ